MKKQILSIAATLTLILPMSIIGFAGLSGRVSANIPFDFTVGNKEFKSGKYAVSRLFNGNTADTLIIRSADNSEAANFNVNSVTGKGDSQARLVFRRYGNQYFLAQIFDGESREGYGLLKSKTEREAAKKRDVITQNVAEPDVVTVVAQIGR
ncbi:MAG TPA: hypothetical protein VFV58_24705 [Blastocatellia bacterium]|nr:hypothetical protein [Blastocatellia bacterium]